MNGFQTLLVDGYISQTFRSLAAEQYFLNLLKSSSIPSHATSPYTWREGYFFFVYSVPPHIPPRSLNPPGYWTLDRVIAVGGTVVPQTMWSPGSPVNRRQNIEKASLQMPIFFEDKNGGLGVSLGASIDGGCDVRDADDPAPLGPRTTTHIRILWPGYKHFKRQIPIRDESVARNTITMARFACQVGRSVDTFLQVCEVDSECDDHRGKLLWQIGPGGIQRSDIIIIGAVHISAGSWMPIMQLNRYIF